MSQSVLILGRQPALGIAELESLYGADCIRLVGQQAILLDKDISELNYSRLGGATRLARYLTHIPTADWEKIEKYIAEELPKHTCCLPEGKIKLGVSVFGLKVNLKRLNASGLSFKKAVKDGGRSVRVVPNKGLELNTAQVIHNQLTSPTGMELLLIKDGDQTILAQTVSVQDITAYAARDQARPARDARVGMLPPKLAQIIINLAKPSDDSTVLDPFCGTGVVLQEASLMGLSAYGTDLDERMIDYSRRNMSWLTETHDTKPVSILAVADATSYKWDSRFDSVACETFLGRPLSSVPDQQTLNKIIQDVDTIHRKFLRNLASQTKPGFRACIAVPAWITKNRIKHLKVLDSLRELGYNRLGFVHANNEDLIYHRDNQIVGRELVILVRI